VTVAIETKEKKQPVKQDPPTPVASITKKSGSIWDNFASQASQLSQSSTQQRKKYDLSKKAVRYTITLINNSRVHQSLLM
jgi:hypothetical protein